MFQCNSELLKLIVDLIDTLHTLYVLVGVHITCCMIETFNQIDRIHDCQDHMLQDLLNVQSHNMAVCV